MGVRGLYMIYIYVFFTYKGLCMQDLDTVFGVYPYIALKGVCVCACIMIYIYM